jgi:hypothetical protein
MAICRLIWEVLASLGTRMEMGRMKSEEREGRRSSWNLS